MKYKTRWLRHLISYPFLFVLIVPIVLIDLMGEIYHRISFPLYSLPYIKRSEYIVIDRHKLKYLNWFQKICCVYCGYANGYTRYASAIASETERYWCGIIHKQGKMQPHQKDFLPYDDEQAYKEFLNK